jgi:8-oxo-dGTP pyrophosphatase MutT (NUDIX family)
VTATGCDGCSAPASGTTDVGQSSGTAEACAGEAAGADGPQPAIPGWLADLARAAAAMPVPAALRPPVNRGRHSAILILFGTGSAGPDSPDLLLVQRSNSLRRHAGQPAFPGGVIDSGDDGPIGAALREAAEEAGVDPAGVDVVTVLPDLYITRTGYRVTPVLGWWREPAPVAPGDPAEVASVARVPVAELADPDRRIMIRYPSGQAGPAFLVADMLIWGFTAFVIDRLLAMGGWELPWDAGRVTDLPPGMALTGIDGGGAVN